MSIIDRESFKALDKLRSLCDSYEGYVPGPGWGLFFEENFESAKSLIRHELERIETKQQKEKVMKFEIVDNKAAEEQKKVARMYVKIDGAGDFCIMVQKGLQPCRDDDHTIAWINSKTGKLRRPEFSPSRSFLESLGFKFDSSGKLELED